MNNSMDNIRPPRMRSVPQAATQLKADGINVGPYRLRIWIKQGVIPTVHCGKKVLLNYDKLLEYLSNGGGEQA